MYFTLTGILGNSGLTSAMLSFISAKKVTNPIFYLASLLENGTNRTSMRAINTSLVSAGVSKKSANVTQAVNVVNEGDSGSIASFNANSTTAAEKFTHVTEEIEFWKSNPYVDSFAEYVTNCDEIKEWADSNSIKFDAYYARCRDVANVATPEEIADYMVATFDTLKLVDYVTTEKFNTYSGFSPSIVNEFQLIADAAKRANKVQKIELIFAANGNDGANMRTYFIANPKLLAAYNTSKSKYNTLTLNNKTNLNFLGMTIYSYAGVSDL